MIHTTIALRVWKHKTSDVHLSVTRNILNTMEKYNSKTTTNIKGHMIDANERAKYVREYYALST